MPPRRVRLPWLVAFLSLALAGGALPCLMIARDWANEGIALADLHVRHEVAHPGWSFPAVVQSAPTPLAGLAPTRAVAEAKVRGYAEDCGKAAPSGSYCGKKGKQRVVPRSGADVLEPIVLGRLIGPDGELRTHLPLATAPKHLLDAIVAAEDRNFRDHGGVNWTATVRAAIANTQEGGYAQGASTLTMQVVRNLAQRKEKTLSRKLREMVQAMAVDSHLGKDGVLQIYLDAPYLGQWGSYSVCGFQEAARYYFGKDAADLTLAEAATLAAILPAPGKFAPDRAPEKAKERRDRVLRAMAELYGYDVTEALAAPVMTVPPAPLPERWPAYLGATRAWLEATVSPDVLYGAGLTIAVGVDPVAQAATEELFPKKTKWFEGLIGKSNDKARLEAAGVLVDAHSGLLRAVYGGGDVTATSFNRATQARRQPGSSFKPLTYAMAFEQKNPDGTPTFTAATAEPNTTRTFDTPQGKWTPRNVGGEYSATASLAQGLAWSQNIATASLLADAGGPKALKAFAKTLGFDVSKFPDEMGLCLGQGEVTVLEMGQFAATIANGGRKVTGSPVLSAIDGAGREVVKAPALGDAVMTPETAALTRELMRLVIDIGTGGASRGAGGEAGYNGQAMGKTGTTDQEKDLWFVGASPDLAAAVWIGYDQPTPLGVAASDLAAPLWGWWMHAVTRDVKELPTFPAVPKLTFRGICRETGKLGNETCHGIRAPFLPGTAPKAGCTLEHPPKPEEDDATAEALEGAGEGEGAPKKPKHESLWKRMAREQAERDAAKAEGAGAEAPSGNTPKARTGKENVPAADAKKPKDGATKPKDGKAAGDKGKDGATKPKDGKAAGDKGKAGGKAKAPKDAR